jgi:hypothetical protein
MALLAQAETQALFRDPQTAYTWELLRATAG